MDSYDEASWSNAAAPLEERARAHGRYEAWILEQVVRLIHGDCGGPQEIVTTGSSLGAYHAAGHDVAHDRPSWRAQIAQHLPRFC